LSITAERYLIAAPDGKNGGAVILLHEGDSAELA
jgi:hypothetical protein